MADITRYSPHEVVAASGPGGLGAGRDVNSTQWSGTVVAFDELNAQVAPGGTVIVECVEDDRRVRRNRRSGRYFMRRIGWQARLDRIIVIVCERDVVPQPDGRFQPQGEWRTSSTVEHPSGGPVRNRTGDVLDDARNPSLGPPHSAASDTSDAAPDSRSDRELNYLPRAVRAGVLQLVPTPTYFHCQAVQVSVADRPSHHQVALLRMAEGTAVVVLASRQVHADTWQVQQVQYTLGASRERIESSNVPRLP